MMAPTMICPLEAVNMTLLGRKRVFADAMKLSILR